LARNPNIIIITTPKKKQHFFQGEKKEAQQEEEEEEEEQEKGEKGDLPSFHGRLNATFSRIQKWVPLPN